MSSLERTLSFSLAINEALHQTMEQDPCQLLIGQGVKSPWYVGYTCRGLLERFGARRVIDSPVSENAVTGAAVGAAIWGALHRDPPTNGLHALRTGPHHQSGCQLALHERGTSNVPVVIWSVINRGGEQGAQHSQALHSIFAHVPD
jgi:pyruvate dehydrogenase E1 component beta subunit